MFGKNKNPDWAYLAKYQNENAQIISHYLNENKVVFLGDSIIAGWETDNLIFFNNKKLINRGINGQTTPQMLIRFRPDVIELNPEAVIILAGTNDIAGNTGYMALETILGNLISMSELAKVNDIKPILSSILPTVDYPWQKGKRPAEKIKKMNQMILEYAKANDILYVDFYSAMVDEQDGLQSIYSEDGVHPNKQGYYIMESILQSALIQ